MDSPAGCQEFLERKNLVSEKQAPFYLCWVSSSLFFCSEENLYLPMTAVIIPFLHHMAKTKEDWQADQA